MQIHRKRKLESDRLRALGNTLWYLFAPSYGIINSSEGGLGINSSEPASNMAPAYLPHCGEDHSGTLSACSPPWRKELVELGFMSSSGLCLLLPIFLQASRFPRMPRFLSEPAQTCSKVNKWTMFSSIPESGHQGSSLGCMGYIGLRCAAWVATSWPQSSFGTGWSWG